MVASYTEIESGRKAERPQLLKAIAHAKRAKATLIIAKLDRFSRNVAFVSNLMESGVTFVACDNPQANRLTVHILAAVAEQEARSISERTKAALAAAKARGIELGRNNLTKAGGRRGALRAAAVHRAARQVAYADLLPTIEALRGAGLSYRAIAARLNVDGQRTRRDAAWNAGQVRRVVLGSDVPLQPSSAPFEGDRCPRRPSVEAGRPGNSNATGNGTPGTPAVVIATGLKRAENLVWRSSPPAGPRMLSGGHRHRLKRECPDKIDGAVSISENSRTG
jgi:DNA invertase Pin-like site-specific DNA recombinase